MSIYNASTVPNRKRFWIFPKSLLLLDLRILSLRCLLFERMILLHWCMILLHRFPEWNRKVLHFAALPIVGVCLIFVHWKRLVVSPYATRVYVKKRGIFCRKSLRHKGLGQMLFKMYGCIPRHPSRCRGLWRASDYRYHSLGEYRWWYRER